MCLCIEITIFFENYLHLHDHFDFREFKGIIQSTTKTIWQIYAHPFKGVRDHNVGLQDVVSEILTKEAMKLS